MRSSGTPFGKPFLPARLAAAPLALAAGLAGGLGAGMTMGAPQARAQPSDAPPPVATETGRRSQRAVYAAADFARFAPRNALDMLNNVPGFTMHSADDARGLGQATENVLIDGKRMASKSEPLDTRLSRIPASNVVRIEIVDGATLDIPGLSGPVANIVTSGSRALSGQFAWKPNLRPHYAHPGYTGGSISVKGVRGPVDFTVALTNDANRGAAGGGTRITAPGGTRVETREAVLTSDNDNPTLSTALAIKGPGTSLINLNGSYARTYQDVGEADAYAPVLGDPYARAYAVRVRGFDYELGGDVEFALGPGRLKLIGLDRYKHEVTAEQAVYTRTDGQDGTRFAQRSDSGEVIARGEYTWKAGGADWQLAAEGAFNRLDNLAGLAVLDSSGEFVSIPFPGGAGGVRERRYEASLSYGRPLAANLTMQLVVAGESSTISQTRVEMGQEPVRRTFRRPKGSLNLSWTPRRGLDVSLALSRKVGQLDFGDFLASADLERGNQNASNLSLVPQQSWEAELTVDRDLGAWGRTNLRLYARRITDYVDIVPLPGGVEGRGNIDSARVSGLQWTSTLQMDRLGFHGAKLDATLILEHSRLRDPVTGALRPLSNDNSRELDLSLRHDIPHSDFAWGADFSYSRYTPYYRLAEYGRDYEGPIFAGVYVEDKDVAGMTLRLTATNLLNGRQRLLRTVYDGPRGTGEVLYRENRDRLIGPIFRASLSGNF